MDFMKPLVLVVDDSLDVCEWLEAHLREIGFEVKSARDGKEALALLYADPNLPVAVVLDLSMPVMDGWQTLFAIRSQPRFSGVAVFIHSSRSPDGINPADHQGFFRKGVGSRKLLETLGSFVSR